MASAATASADDVVLSGIGTLEIRASGGQDLFVISVTLGGALAHVDEMLDIAEVGPKLVDRGPKDFADHYCTRA